MYTKKEANYKQNSKRKQCKNCFHYKPKRCTLVEGVISPTGSCDYWKKK